MKLQTIFFNLHFPRVLPVACQCDRRATAEAERRSVLLGTSSYRRLCTNSTMKPYGGLDYISYAAVYT